MERRMTRIMPLGDSNTYGMYENPASPGGYRGPLQDMLRGRNLGFDLVGVDRDGRITDRTRIERLCPTIRELAERRSTGSPNRSTSRSATATEATATRSTPATRQPPGSSSRTRG